MDADPADTVRTVSSEETVVSAADLERMTPQQRLEVVEASTIHGWDQVSESFRTEVEAAALRLGELRRARA